MGKRYSEITTEADRAAYKVERGDNDTVRVRLHDRLYTAQEISAIILQKCKKLQKTI